ncbi:lipoate--protein ligase family protein [Sulfurovum sp. NBC37-1]|uniref:lipoate--protein ligase family protein n=1 Tax=Sulfurovum sp. (strain NBC37-1) TaxID=387093 RepID=UPI000158772A|nr:biotin/lipoate A/B protein ligase family protein [Sulfurovum sp. NBC37-1]BAF71923.1 lipoate protein ligase [Sulfurovum sp. NBC37-1]
MVNKVKIQLWRFIDSPAASAQWNMAVDEALLTAFKEEDLPIFRLYRWEEASLSFGRFSQPKETLDWNRVRTEGIPCVRRITGGGILVHGSDISYSLIVPHTYVRDKGVREAYRELCAFLIRLYKLLEIDAGFALDRHLPETQSTVCLAGTEAYDIVTDGRKIGGNAQRHTHHAMLQHGTIPLEINRERFETLFLKESGLSQAATLRETDRGMTEEVLKEKIIKAFSDTFDATLQKEPLNEAEQVLAQTLFDKKYSQEAWNVHAKSSL